MRKVEKILWVVMILGFIILTCVQFTYAQTQTPLTKEQIEERLQNVRIEKRFLQLQVEEKNLMEALKNMEATKKAEPAKPAPKKAEDKK